MDDKCEFNQSGPEGQCEQTAHWLVEGFRLEDIGGHPNSRVQSCDEHVGDFLNNDFEDGEIRFNVEHF